MSALELVIWSMALGVVAAVVTAGLVDLLQVRSAGAAQGFAYHFAALLFVLLLSGIPLAVNPALDGPVLRAAQVLIGPLCSALGNYWIRGWLAAHQRDRLMEVALRMSAWATPPAALAVLLAVPAQQQLPAAAAICLTNSVLVSWLGVRAWLLGDRLALGIGIGCLLMLPAIGGLYARAMGLPLATGLQALLAACTAGCVALIGFMLWQRNRHERKARADQPVNSEFDPVTKLYSGITLVQKLIKAQRRRRRTRRDGAVIAVLVFNADKIAEQAGTAALNEVFIHVAHRIQRQVGVVNPVGRYWDRCFVTLVETIHSPAWLRTLGLRVASSLRRPIEVTGPDGSRIELRADVGVGVVHLSRSHAQVEDILHDAQRMAEAARAMRSRAAILDPASGEVVPVEDANLGPRRHGRAEQVPHAVAARPARG